MTVIIRQNTGEAVRYRLNGVASISNKVEVLLKVFLHFREYDNSIIDRRRADNTPYCVVKYCHPVIMFSSNFLLLYSILSHVVSCLSRIFTYLVIVKMPSG